MAGKKNGAVDITVEILKEIRDEVRKTNAEVRETNAEVRETNARLDRGFDSIGQRIDGLGERIDNVLLGEHREEHQRLRERVTRLEQHVGLTR